MTCWNLSSYFLLRSCIYCSYKEISSLIFSTKRWSSSSSFFFSTFFLFDSSLTWRSRIFFSKSIFLWYSSFFSLYLSSYSLACSSWSLWYSSVSFCYRSFFLLFSYVCLSSSFFIFFLNSSSLIFSSSFSFLKSSVSNLTSVAHSSSSSPSTWYTDLVATELVYELRDDLEVWLFWSEATTFCWLFWDGAWLILSASLLRSAIYCLEAVDLAV